MGVQVPGRSGARGPRDARKAELGYLEHGVIIVALLSAALALLLLPGCGDEPLKGVAGRLHATPSPLRFGVVAVDHQVQKSIVFHNDGTAPLRILAIEPVDEFPSAFLLPEPPAGTIDVTGTRELGFGFAPGEERAFEGRVRIRTDSSEEPEVIVHLSGEGARPRVECTQSLDFGRIVLNTEKVLRITCVNAGAVDAQLHVIGKEGEDADLFEVGENLVSNPVLVPAGEALLVEVRYTALFLGKVSARAILEVPGAAEPVRFVDLTGEGFASDLVATPNCLHFGAVNVGGVGERTVTVYNGGDTTVVFDALRLQDTSGVFSVAATTVGGVEAPLEVLDPGGQAEVRVRFAPTAIGTYAGALQIRSDDATNPRMEVCLTGQGGGADIVVQPDEVDFGTIAPQMRATAYVIAINGGTLDGGPLEILGVEVDDPANFTVKQPQSTTLTPNGERAVIEIEYHPQAIGPVEATLTIHSTDGDTPAYAVPLRAAAAELPPCAWVAAPPALHFGRVQPDADATLAARLVNVGDETCVFSSVALAPGSSSAFSQPDGPIGVARVPPGGSLDVPVRFAPGTAGTYSGAVHFYVSSPDPFGSIPITGTAESGCLVAQPAAVDFGLQRISCPAVTRTVRVTNACSRRVTLSDAVWGPGGTAELVRLPVPALPLELVPGASTTLSLRYDPVDEGHDAAPLLLASSEYELSVPVHGAGTANDQRTDVFLQSARSAVDVLFVVDNSGSMMEEQQAIGQAFDQFIQYAVSQGIDYHIGVTTTGLTPSGGGWSDCPGGVDGGEAGRLFPVTGERPRYITSSTIDPVGIFRQNVQVGVCHWWEEGLEAAYRALTPPLVDNADAPNTPQPNDGNLGFYRPDARLSVIIVTDEDDHSDKDVGFYTHFFQNLKGPSGADRVTVHGVLGDGCSTASGGGDRYKAVIQATGGSVESICTSDWGDSLVNLAQETFGYSLRFPLSGRPESVITVRVNGVNLTGGWTYDASTNQVVFTEKSAPPPGARIEITYTPACGT